MYPDDAPEEEWESLHSYPRKYIQKTIQSVIGKLPERITGPTFQNGIVTGEITVMVSQIDELLSHSGINGLYISVHPRRNPEHLVPKHHIEWDTSNRARTFSIN